MVRVIDERTPTIIDEVHHLSEADLKELAAASREHVDDRPQVYTVVVDDENGESD